MPIERRAKDGRIIEFPDDMPPEEIADAMAKLDPLPTPTAAPKTKAPFPSFGQQFPRHEGPFIPATKAIEPVASAVDLFTGAGTSKPYVTGVARGVENLSMPNTAAAGVGLGIGMAAAPAWLAGLIGTGLTATQVYRGISKYLGAEDIPDPAERTATKTEAATETILGTGGPIGIPFLKVGRGLPARRIPEGTPPVPPRPSNTAPGMPFAPPALPPAPMGGVPPPAPRPPGPLITPPAPPAPPAPVVPRPMAPVTPPSGGGVPAAPAMPVAQQPGLQPVPGAATPPPPAVVQPPPAPVAPEPVAQPPVPTQLRPPGPRLIEPIEPEPVAPTDPALMTEEQLIALAIENNRAKADKLAPVINQPTEPESAPGAPGLTEADIPPEILEALRQRADQLAPVLNPNRPEIPGPPVESIPAPPAAPETTIGGPAYEDIAPGEMLPRGTEPRTELERITNRKDPAGPYNDPAKLGPIGPTVSGGMSIPPPEGPEPPAIEGLPEPIQSIVAPPVTRLPKTKRGKSPKRLRWEERMRKAGYDPAAVRKMTPEERRMQGIKLPPSYDPAKGLLSAILSEGGIRSTNMRPGDWGEWEDLTSAQKMRIFRNNPNAPGFDELPDILEAYGYKYEDLNDLRAAVIKELQGKGGGTSLDPDQAELPEYTESDAMAAKDAEIADLQRQLDELQRGREPGEDEDISFNIADFEDQIVEAAGGEFKEPGQVVPMQTKAEQLAEIDEKLPMLEEMLETAGSRGEDDTVKAVQEAIDRNIAKREKLAPAQTEPNPLLEAAKGTEPKPAKPPKGEKLLTVDMSEREWMSPQERTEYALFDAKSKVRGYEGYDFEVVADDGATITVKRSRTSRSPLYGTQNLPSGEGARLFGRTVEEPELLPPAPERAETIDDVRSRGAKPVVGERVPTQPERVIPPKRQAEIDSVVSRYVNQPSKRASDFDEAVRALRTLGFTDTKASRMLLKAEGEAAKAAKKKPFDQPTPAPPVAAKEPAGNLLLDLLKKEPTPDESMPPIPEGMQVIARSPRRTTAQYLEGKREAKEINDRLKKEKLYLALADTGLTEPIIGARFGPDGVEVQTESKGKQTWWPYRDLTGKYSNRITDTEEKAVDEVKSGRVNNPMLKLAEDVKQLGDKTRNQVKEDLLTKILNAPETRVSKREQLGLEKKKKKGKEGGLFDEPPPGLFGKGPKSVGAAAAPGPKNPHQPYLPTKKAPERPGPPKLTPEDRKLALDLRVRKLQKKAESAKARGDSESVRAANSELEYVKNQIEKITGKYKDPEKEMAILGRQIKKLREEQLETVRQMDLQSSQKEIERHNKSFGPGPPLVPEAGYELTDKYWSKELEITNLQSRYKLLKNNLLEAYEFKPRMATGEDMPYFHGAPIDNALGVMEDEGTIKGNFGWWGGGGGPVGGGIIPGLVHKGLEHLSEAQLAFVTPHPGTAHHYGAKGSKEIFEDIFGEGDYYKWTKKYARPFVVFEGRIPEGTKIYHGIPRINTMKKRESGGKKRFPEVVVEGEIPNFVRKIYITPEVTLSEKGQELIALAHKQRIPVVAIQPPPRKGRAWERANYRHPLDAKKLSRVAEGKDKPLFELERTPITSAMDRKSKEPPAPKPPEPPAPESWDERWSERMKAIERESAPMIERFMDREADEFDRFALGEYYEDLIDIVNEIEPIVYEIGDTASEETRQLLNDAKAFHTRIGTLLWRDQNLNKPKKTSAVYDQFFKETMRELHA